MDITIHSSFLPHNDPEASMAFFRDVLGFEVRMDVGYEGMRWITVGPANQPGTSIVLHPPAAGPGITDDERRTILELMAKGLDNRRIALQLGVGEKRVRNCVSDIYNKLAVPDRAQAIVLAREAGLGRGT